MLACSLSMSTTIAGVSRSSMVRGLPRAGDVIVLAACAALVMVALPSLCFDSQYPYDTIEPSASLGAYSGRRKPCSMFDSSRHSYLAGNIPTIATPMRDGAVDHASLRSLLAYIDPYVDGYLTCGSVGEGASLDGGRTHRRSWRPSPHFRATTSGSQRTWLFGTSGTVAPGNRLYRASLCGSWRGCAPHTPAVVFRHFAAHAAADSMLRSLA